MAFEWKLSSSPHADLYDLPLNARGVRRGDRTFAGVAVAFATLLLILAGPLAAQSGAGIQPPQPPSDSIGHRPAPLSYFFRSLLIPGWGQASLDRKLTGGLFVAFEGLAWSMTLKSNSEIRFLDRTDSATALSRRSERQDWVALIVFNHLFSALEAYVSAHLLDFPSDLHVRALPGGRAALGVSIGIGH